MPVSYRRRKHRKGGGKRHTWKSRAVQAAKTVGTLGALAGLSYLGYQQLKNDSKNANLKLALDENRNINIPSTPTESAYFLNQEYANTIRRKNKNKTRSVIKDRNFRDAFLENKLYGDYVQGIKEEVDDIKQQLKIEKADAKAVKLQWEKWIRMDKAYAIRLENNKNWLILLLPYNLYLCEH